MILVIGPRRWRLGLFFGAFDLGRCPRLVWGRAFGPRHAERRTQQARIKPDQYSKAPSGAVSFSTHKIRPELDDKYGAPTGLDWVFREGLPTKMALLTELVATTQKR